MTYTPPTKPPWDTADSPPKEGLPHHRAAALIRDMDADDFEPLKRDIAENGQIESIKTLGGEILDSRHRERACLLGEAVGDDPIGVPNSAAEAPFARHAEAVGDAFRPSRRFQGTHGHREAVAAEHFQAPKLPE